MNQVEHEEKMKYRLLGRLQSDCEYYLGWGYRSPKRLYYHNEIDHINEMKKLYNSFLEAKRPQWLTMAGIEEYERKMIVDTAT